MIDFASRRNNGDRSHMFHEDSQEKTNRANIKFMIKINYFEDLKLFG